MKSTELVRHARSIEPRGTVPGPAGPSCRTFRPIRAYSFAGAEKALYLATNVLLGPDDHAAL